MVSSINNDTTYVYQPRSKKEAEAGALLACFTSSAVMALLPQFSKPFQKQLRDELPNNAKYKDMLTDAFEKSGLKEKGVRIVDMQLTPRDRLLINSGAGDRIPHLDVKLGKNAFYAPSVKKVCLNTKKAAISGFHELGHAMNHLNSKFGNILQKLRGPGQTVAAIMGIIALTSRSKRYEDEKRNPYQFIQDNCGKIALISMLPIVIEEAMASIKGVKLAKATNAAPEIIKSLRKIYGKALMTYGGFAILSGLSVYLASKIMEKSTKPKKVEY